MIDREGRKQKLKQLQALPLDEKVALTEQRIADWVKKFGIDGVYVSFSGGKDSTVLLDIARKMYPEIKAAFSDTGLEFPEIREFVKSYENVDWVKPKKTFKKVIEDCGYPFISKEVSESVNGARRFISALLDKIESGEITYEKLEALTTPPHVVWSYEFKKLFGIAEFANRADRQPDMQTRGGIEEMLNSDWMKTLLKQRSIEHRDGRREVAKFLDMISVTGAIGNINVEKDISPYNNSKWKFMLQAPFTIGNGCCRVMKKTPLHKYSKDTGRKPITAQMASESRLRTAEWVVNGCNAFDARFPVSNPMAFWVEQDVLLYCKLNNINICSVYGDIVTENGKEIDLTNYVDKGSSDQNRPRFKTTLRSRTGCMFCGYGCHLEKAGMGRFEKLKETHPKQYDYIMRPKEQGGLNYKEIIDWMNENGGLHIRY